MTVAPEVISIFGWRNGKPNIADSSSRRSIEIAGTIFNALDITRVSRESGQTLGVRLERAVAAFLNRTVPKLAPERSWNIASQPLTDFAQYSHLARIRELAEEDQYGILQSSLGTDYLIRPDITIGIGTDAPQHLHAAVSCKWTIRSDRVQNIRHEGIVLTRHRRGRQPHIVAVTAEPLPSRLAAIAQGTGELDCVYHVALEQLTSACREDRGLGDVIDILVAQDRLRPLDTLPDVIAYY